MGRSTSYTISAHLAAEDVRRLDCVGFELGNTLLRQREVAQLLVEMTAEQQHGTLQGLFAALDRNLPEPANGDRGADLPELGVPAATSQTSGRATNGPAGGKRAANKAETAPNRHSVGSGGITCRR